MDSTDFTLRTSNLSTQRPSTAPSRIGSTRGNSTLSQTRTAFLEANEKRDKTIHYTARYQSSHHNVLKSTERYVAKESIKLGNVGANGISRYDVQPALERKAYDINSFYKADARNRFGLPNLDTKKGERPVFTLKGLQNHSSLVYGDSRVQRASTQYHETYTDPATRASLTPKYDHLQQHEPVDDDGKFGQIHIIPPPTGALGEAEAELREARRSYYREATESIDLREVDALERLVRAKMEQKAAGKSGSYYLKSCFRFFDQNSRGAIQLEAFTKGLFKLGIDADHLDPHLLTALFARYDTKLRGFIGYYEFTDEVIGDKLLEQRESHALTKNANAILGAVRQTGTLQGAVDPLREVDVHSLTDEAFSERQKIRKIFRAIDRDNNGSLEKGELERLLVLLGIRVAPSELTAIFRFIDENDNGHVSFDEFYSWYSAEPNDLVKAARKYQVKEQFRRPSTTEGTLAVRKHRFR